MRWQRFVGITTLALMVALVSLTVASSAWGAEYKVLYKFRGWPDDGAQPEASLIFDAAGNLYGTTYAGGAYGYGAVFKLAPHPDGSWSESVLYSFMGYADGASPTASLVFDAAGNLYGTTSEGGGTEMCSFTSYFGCGTVFKLAPNPDGTWTESVLHDFAGVADGGVPYAGLIFDAAGSLYGTTAVGGSADCYGYGCGTVFKLAPNPDGSWTESVLYSLTDGYDGSYPVAGLVFDAAGSLYGTAEEGYYGTVFKLTPNPDGSWTPSVLHRFNVVNGDNPWAGLIFDAAGNLYGTTLEGGAWLVGTVFELTPNPDGSWTEQVIRSLGKRAQHPRAGLVRDVAGNLYGTTSGGYGEAMKGRTVFKLAPNPDGSWTMTKLHVFGRGLLTPLAGLVMDAAGNLYGTGVGGRKGDGVVFKITP